MIWRTQKPKHGDTRITRKFLWRPRSYKCSDTGLVTAKQWLEFVYEKQEYAEKFYKKGWVRKCEATKREYEHFIRVKDL